MRVFDWEGQGVTPFQRRVYEATLRIPRGRVATYQEIGRAIGCASPRAIGQALRRNPFAPEVPCHRVVASGGAIGGFGGESEGGKIREKLALLREEGVEFREGQMRDPQRLHIFPRSARCFADSVTASC